MDYTEFDSVNFIEYMPPYNLGPARDYHYMTKVYSEIWGINPDTGEPYEFDVPIDLAFLGQWAFLYIGECIHPVAPLKKFDQSQLRNLKTGDKIWMWDDPLHVVETQWDEDELTGMPDRIHFKYTLPAELQVADVGAREFPVSLQVIRAAVEGKQQWNYETNDNGKLVVADTGAMEIRGNYNFPAYYAEKKSDGTMFKDVLMVYKSEVIDCGSANTMLTKNDKKAGYPETGYWVGFRPFCLTLYLDGATWGQQVDEGTIDESDVPTVETVRNYYTKHGRDVDLRSKSILAMNEDKTARLNYTIKHYKDILDLFKQWYDDLPEAKKEEAKTIMIEIPKKLKECWPTINDYIDLTSYLKPFFPSDVSPPNDNSGDVPPVDDDGSGNPINEGDDDGGTGGIKTDAIVSRPGGSSGYEAPAAGADDEEPAVEDKADEPVDGMEIEP